FREFYMSHSRLIVFSSLLRPCLFLYTSHDTFPIPFLILDSIPQTYYFILHVHHASSSNHRQFRLFPFPARSKPTEKPCQISPPPPTTAPPKSPSSWSSASSSSASPSGLPSASKASISPIQKSPRTTQNSFTDAACAMFPTKKPASTPSPTTTDTASPTPPFKNDPTNGDPPISTTKTAIYSVCAQISPHRNSHRSPW